MVRRADLAAMLLDDAVGDRQTEARSLADLLRRIERLENARQRVLGDSGPGVADGRDNAVAVLVEHRGDFDASGVARRRDRVFRVHHHVEEHLMKEQRIALDARQVLVIVSHDFDIGGAAGGRAQRQHLLQDGVDADRSARQAARSGEHQQVFHDFRRPLRFTVNRLDFAPQLLRKRAGCAKQLEMSEDALQRIVQFMSDSRHELSERRQFFGLRQPLAQGLAFHFEPGVRRQVAQDNHAADVLPVVVQQIGDRDHERALEDGIDELARGRGFVARAGRCPGVFVEPVRELGADHVAERKIDEVFARAADAGRKRLVHVHDVPASIEHRNQVRDRIERVLELAPRAHHVVDQLQILDGMRELAADFVGAVEQIELTAGVEADTFHVVRRLIVLHCWEANASYSDDSG